MFNSERMLKQSTQVVYLNCLEEGEKNLIENDMKGPFSILQLILAAIDTNLIKEFYKDEKNCKIEKINEIIKYSKLDEQDKQIILQFEEEIFYWKIIYIHNMTDKNGFYGCVIETNSDNAIIAFRGSDGLKNYSGIIYDWLLSDFGLLNNTDTIQTIETERYVTILNKMNILNQYKTLDIAGHSLGGNLASHFAIVCARNEETESIVKKIKGAYNFDGPGVSDEYILKNKNSINKVSSKIMHYKWSPIGSLLYDIPEENVIFLKTKKYYGKGGIKSRIGYYILGKHDTRSIMFDEFGIAKRGKEGFLAKQFKYVSHELEHVPKLTHSIYSVIALIVKKCIYKKKNGKIGFKCLFHS